MKIISVVGYSNTGKTTIIERMISVLKSRGYRVGTIKKIHCGDYGIDKPGKDTYRHKAAGADIVTACSPYSTDILIQKIIDIRKVIELYDVDYIFLEGLFDLVYPTIVTAAAYEDVEPFLNNKILFISGIISESVENYQKYRVLNANRDVEHIIKLLENM